MQKSKIITINNNQENARIANSLWHKILPIVLVLSFMFYTFYPAVMSANGTIASYNNISLNPSTTLWTEIITMGLIELLFFEIIFWAYRFILGFSIYTYMIPSLALKDTFKWCIVLNNVIVGLCYLLCFKFPFLYFYFDIFEIFVLFAVFLVFVFRCTKNYSYYEVDHLIFKALMLPFIVYIFIEAGFGVVRCLL